MKNLLNRTYRNSFLILFFSGIALRVLHSALSLDMVYPDEHFQVLEPANHLAGGAAFFTSEWKIGMRSWILPALYTPFIWVVRSFGYTDGPLAIQVSRLVTVVVTAFTSWQLLRLLIERKLKEESVLVTLALYWLLPPIIIWDSTTFSETASMAAVWIAMPWIVATIEESVSSSFLDLPRKWIGVGFLASLPWVFRYPMGAWTLGILGAYIYFYRPSRKRMAWILLGAAIPIIVAGALDWLTWGRPFHSLIAFIRINIMGGVAAGHGVSPWFAYVGLFFKNLGAAPCILVLMMWAISHRIGALVLLRRDRMILAACAFYVVFHSLISHKEIRFLLPIFPVVFYFLALFLDGIFSRMPDFLADLRRLLRQKIFLLVLLAFLLPASWSSVSAPGRFDESDMSDLSLTLSEKLRADSVSSASCLLVVETQFVWTRGRMLLGDRLKIREVSLSEIKERLSTDPNTFAGCNYALSATGTEGAFISLMDRSWQVIAKNENGHLLFTRKGTP